MNLAPSHQAILTKSPKQRDTSCVTERSTFIYVCLYVVWNQLCGNEVNMIFYRIHFEKRKTNIYIINKPKQTVND